MVALVVVVFIVVVFLVVAFVLVIFVNNVFVVAPIQNFKNTVLSQDSPCPWRAVGRGGGTNLCSCYQ